LLPGAKPGGRPRSVDLREVLNGILYVVRGGASWRMLPNDLPPWGTVRYYDRCWRLDGTWEKVSDALRTRLRHAQGRKKSPSAAVVDRQNIRTANGGQARGYDAGKRTPGRKRHIIVDTLGLLLAVVVHSASVQDRDGVKLVGQRIKGRFPRLKLIWADGAYEAAVGWAKQFAAWVLELVRKPDGHKGFVALPPLWVVERTFAWLMNSRRLARDYERLTESSEAVVQVAMIHLMLNRLNTA
jgi:putative transposase